MKSFLKILKGNKGSGMMTVMLAVLFLTAFGTLALYLTYTSFQVAASDRISKEVTYNANTCMEEVKAGVQDIVSDAIEKTYREVMPHYTQKAGDITKEFAQKYFEFVADWTDAGGQPLFIVNKIMGNDPVTGEEIVLGYADTGTYTSDAVESLIKEKRGDNNRVEVYASGSDTENGQVVVNKDEEGNPTAVILKGINVKFTGKQNRSSTVTADIKISVPNIGYLLTQYAISGIPEFTLICSNTLEQNVAAQDTTINGSAYAGTISLNDTGKMRVYNNSTLICKDNLLINGKISEATPPNLFSKNMRFMLDSSSTLWAGNIEVGNLSSVKLTGTTYVANDLLLSGNNATAFISGKYQGFGSSDTIPSQSSSIISNGPGSLLSIERVNQLMLSGVSFVNNEDRSEYGITEGGISGVRMGESVSGKDNQRLYFAPAGSVSCYKKIVNADGFERNSSTGHYIKTDALGNHTYYQYDGTTYNEVTDTDEEYKPEATETVLEGAKSKRLILSQTEFQNIDYFDFNTDMNADLNKSFAYYGMKLKPIYQPYSQNSIIVYFFVAFDSQEKANKYFIDYFNNSKDDVTRWLNSYLSSDITGTMFRNFSRSTAGSFYSDFDSKKNLINPVTIDDESIRTLRNESLFISEIFRNYCKTLTNKVVEKDPEKPYTYADNPFDYYINTDRLSSVFNSVFGADNQNHVMNFYSRDKLSAVVARGEYEYTGSNQDIHLIVVFSDNPNVKAKVKVKGDFSGLIICDGDIEISAGATFSSAAEEVISAFMADNAQDHNLGSIMEKIDGDYVIKEFFNIDILEQYESSESSAGDAWNVAELVTFDSWSRK